MEKSSSRIPIEERLLGSCAIGIGALVVGSIVFTPVHVAVQEIKHLYYHFRGYPHELVDHGDSSFSDYQRT